MKAVILVILAALATAQAPVESDSQCLSAVMACVGPAKTVYADVQQIIGGDISGIQQLITDGEALISAVQAAASACGISEPNMFSVQCFQDIESIASNGYQLVQNAAQLVKTKDVSLLESMLDEAKAIVAAGQAAATDCS